MKTPRFRYAIFALLVAVALVNYIDRGAMSYAAGLRSGFLLAQGAFFGVMLLAGGIRLRFGGRKERLLIQHFDEAATVASSARPGPPTVPPRGP